MPVQPAPIPAPIPVTPADVNIPVPQPTPSAPVHYEEVKDISIFSVADPVKGSHTTYTVKGIDMDGEFETSRRYNDFFAVREHLTRHWPGVYVPPIPPKKTTGNKAEEFVEDRCHFLDRFMKQMAKYPALVNSDVFKTFSRPTGETEKVLNMMPKPSPENIIDRYKNCLYVDEFPDDFSVKQAREAINDFSAFCKRIAPVL